MLEALIHITIVIPRFLFGSEEPLGLAMKNNEKLDPSLSDSLT
jgi:hypothetical protein